MATPKLKLYYFELPGRAECTRVLLTVGKVPFEDYRFAREEWPTLKPQMPFGQVPVLEVDGKMLAQSRAIEMYAARVAGLYPADAWEAAQVDQVVSYLQELGEVFIPTFAIKDADEKLKARQELVGGPLKAKLLKLTELIEKSGGEYITGAKLTYADIATYVSLSNLVCGFLDGVPKDLLDSYPTLKAFHTRIASLEPVKSYYSGVSEGFRLAFKPQA